MSQTHFTVVLVKEGLDNEESPLLLLQWYIDMKQVNLLNVFKGKIKNGMVTTDEFRDGLKVNQRLIIVKSVLRDPTIQHTYPAPCTKRPLLCVSQGGL